MRSCTPGRRGELAEKMARLRAKESAARDSFAGGGALHTERRSGGAGLTTLPPHCVISVPQPDAGLAAVTPDA